MPTPNGPILQSSVVPSIHTTCPPDNDRPNTQTYLPADRIDSLESCPSDELTEAVSSPEESQIAIPLSEDEDLAQRIKFDASRRDGTVSESQSPMPSTRELDGKEGESPTGVPDQSSHNSTESQFMGCGFPTTRVRPNYSSSFLRAGSKFIGTQQSDKQIYNVEVSIKHVDMKESFICGYLRIEGLTKDHPTLTTYFEGEIIGPKYTFQTKHESWGATERTDMQHWDRFPAWRPLSNAAKKPDFHYKNCTQRENMFMRWKEFFLVPDHRVREIMGASFEGFYYICFNQISGTVSGIYFHAKSEKFQQLELRHVDDRGCLGSIEFR